MARRKQKPFEISPEHRAKIEEIVELLVQATEKCNQLDRESEKEKNHDIYPELLQAIHRRLGNGDNLYSLKQTLEDADDSEMRCPK